MTSLYRLIATGSEPEIAGQKALLQQALWALPLKRARLCEAVVVDLARQMELRWFYDRRDLAEVKRDLAQWIAKWQAKYPKLVDWVENNIEETLSSYRLPLPTTST